MTNFKPKGYDVHLINVRYCYENDAYWTYAEPNTYFIINMNRFRWCSLINLSDLETDNADSIQDEPDWSEVNGTTAGQNPLCRLSRDRNEEVR